MELVIEESGYEMDRVQESIREIISGNELLSMATMNGSKPHINTAFYCFDEELKLYILTPPDTIHGQNLKKNSSVAVDIHDSHQEWSDKKKGLQIFGRAEKAENVSKALKLYSDRYPEFGDLASGEEELENLDSEFYVIEPQRIKVFDEPEFGTETWINVRIN